LARLGVETEIPPGAPPEVQHLGGLRFRVGDREVEFRKEVVSGRYEFNAELEFSTREEAERFAKSLKAAGVDARAVGPEVVGYTARLDGDSFFGLLAAADATPPGLTLLYRSDKDDFRVYVSTEGGRARFYFAVKHEGTWRAVERLYDEKSWSVMLVRAERAVLETMRSAVAKALKGLGRPAVVEEPKEVKDKGGNVKGCRIRLYGHHFAAFLEHAAGRVKAEPAECGRRAGT